MDLGAYAQIEDIEEVARKNGIYVPRLRGYRLMANEEPVDLRAFIHNKSIETECAEDCIRSRWNPSSHCYEYSRRTDRNIKRYIKNSRKYDDNGDPLSEIRWDAIHGKQRRILKTHIHNSVKRYIDQYSTWNKYAGRADVLYIHARIGGAGNWPYYYQEVVNEPWFLEKVDDAWDFSYCDIYALIKNE